MPPHTHDDSLPTMARVHCIAIEGADARRFAQAQFSGDVESLAPGRWQWNAWLTPQGRVRALMHLVDPGDGTLLAVLRGGEAEEIRAALARYLLRTRATLAAREFASRAEGPSMAGAVQTVGEDIVLGYGSRSLRLGTAPREFDQSADADRRLAEIREGWPSLPAGDPEFLPPALGLEHLGAVAFDKGCYPGQEIAARLHYRGGHKSRLYHLQSAAPLPAGLPEDDALRVLDAVAGHGSADALVVGRVDLAGELKISGVPCRVVSRFDA